MFFDDWKRIVLAFICCSQNSMNRSMHKLRVVPRICQMETLPVELLLDVVKGARPHQRRGRHNRHSMGENTLLLLRPCVNSQHRRSSSSNFRLRNQRDQKKSRSYCRHPLCVVPSTRRQRRGLLMHNKTRQSGEHLFVAWRYHRCQNKIKCFSRLFLHVKNDRVLAVATLAFWTLFLALHYSATSYSPKWCNEKPHKHAHNCAIIHHYFYIYHSLKHQKRLFHHFKAFLKSPLVSCKGLRVIVSMILLRWLGNGKKENQIYVQTTWSCIDITCSSCWEPVDGSVSIKDAIYCFLWIRFVSF